MIGSYPPHFYIWASWRVKAHELPPTPIPSLLPQLQEGWADPGKGTAVMSANKAQQASTSERRAKAIKLRLAGLDWQEIADRLEYSSRGAACADVARALEANRKEEASAADEMRQIETLRLDRLMAGLWPKAASGNVRAAEAALKVIDRRCKLWGLDMRSAAETDPSVALSMIGNIMTAINAAAAPDVGDLEEPDEAPEVDVEALAA